VAKARARVATGKFPHVSDVLVMDAHDFSFPDESFDCVVSQFVITLVENPERVLSECARVTKPGGEIILVNHLYSEKGPAAAIERFAARHVGRFGLRPEFPFSRFEAWAKAHGGVEIVERRKVKPAGVYTLVRIRKAENRGGKIPA
jgi:phosphatidylethanolamine/phosphatidyl-N-methylethanolamine N-methyltransferase